MAHFECNVIIYFSVTVYFGILLFLDVLFFFLFIFSDDISMNRNRLG